MIQFLWSKRHNPPTFTNILVSWVAQLSRCWFSRRKSDPTEPIHPKVRIHIIRTQPVCHTLPFKRSSTASIFNIFVGIVLMCHTQLIYQHTDAFSAEMNGFGFDLAEQSWDLKAELWMKELTDKRTSQVCGAVQLRINTIMSQIISGVYQQSLSKENRHRRPIV